VSSVYNGPHNYFLSLIGLYLDLPFFWNDRDMNLSLQPTTYDLSGESACGGSPLLSEKP